MNSLAIRRRQRQAELRKKEEERRERTLREAREQSARNRAASSAAVLLSQKAEPSVAKSPPPRKQKFVADSPAEKIASSKPEEAAIPRAPPVRSSPSKPLASVTLSTPKASPACSSVSLSQTLQSSSPKKKKSPVQRLYFDSDSSSEEEDLVSQFQRMRKPTAKRKDAVVPCEKTARAEPVARSQQVQMNSDALNDEKERQVFKQRTPLCDRKAFSDDDDDHDDDPIASHFQHMAQSTTSNQSTTYAPLTNSASKHTPRNPLARMEQAAAACSVSSPSRKTGDALWDDSDDEKETSSEKKEKKKRKKKDGKKRGSRDFGADPSHFPQDDYDNGVVLDELKPEFRCPKFEPKPLEPLLLGPEQVSTRHQVPASISRYLPDYQREGVKFMYDQAVVKHEGAILGDDMGCGKTIQVVALLAALLEKKGNGEDLVALKKRRGMARNRMAETNRMEEDALNKGEIWTEPTIREATDLPKWAPVLIVVPPSIIQNWKKDFGTWGHFAFSIYQGSERNLALHEIQYGGAEIMVCARSMLQEEKDVEEMLKVDWKLLVVDEFHNYKNVKGLLSKSLRRLRDKCDSVVLGLTGTPMQNNHDELWNLVDLVSKGFFGQWKQFEMEYSIPIKMARVKENNPEAIQLGKEKGDEITERLKPIYLSRKKNVVLVDALPQKIERIVFCDPTPLQKQLYQHVIKQPDFILLSQASLPCDCGVNLKFFLEYQQLTSKSQQIEYQRKNKKLIEKRSKCCYKVPTDDNAVLWRKQHPDGEECDRCPFCIGFPAIDILLKLSSHAALLQAKAPPEQFVVGCTEHTTAVEDLNKAQVFIPPNLVGKMPGGSYFRNDGIMNEHFALSGKMRVLSKLLKAISKRQGRVLLFSAWTQMLDLIENYIKSEGYTHMRMDGSTTTRKREEYVDLFMKDRNCFIFLLSTKAMALGLNLTGADHVIIFDVEWNPSWDSQAQDRAYRIGQDKDVHVFRLVSTGTIEEQKYLRQVYKTQLKQETLIEGGDKGGKTSARLFNGVQGDKDRKGELFGMANLLKFVDGPIMNYGSGERKDRKRYGDVGIHSKDAVFNTVNDLAPEEIADVVGDEDAAVFADLSSRRVRPDDPEDDTEAILGAESQMALELADKVSAELPRLPDDVIRLEIATFARTAGGPNDRDRDQTTTDTILPAGTTGDPNDRGHDQPTTDATLQANGQALEDRPAVQGDLVRGDEDEILPEDTTEISDVAGRVNIQALDLQVRSPETARVQPIEVDRSSGAHDPGMSVRPVASAASNRAQSSPTKSSAEKEKRKISGKRKKSKKKGGTTFSVFDLALPSGTKKHKKR